MRQEISKVQGAALSEEELRRKAIDLYNQNWKVSEICSQLKCSRSWFYKWLNRYQSRDGSWFQSESRAPKQVHRSVDAQMEALIEKTRKELRASGFAQYGPQAIYYELDRQGYNPPPVWSIARVLKRRQLARPRSKAAYISKGKQYPYDYILCHQMDFVGPRYLSCKARFYFVNIIDCDTHWSQCAVLEAQTSDAVCKELIRFWKIVGIPDFLQMDNDLAFWGSLKVPGAVGNVIRLSLSLGVTPVFIPPNEPWRNGIIEHFNNSMQHYLLKTQYNDLKELREAAAHFDEVHNHTHHYSTQEGMTPSQAYRRFGYPIQALDESYEMPTNKLPLDKGEIHIVRLVRSGLQFNVFGLKFPMPEKAKYEYILGVILIEENRIVIYKDQEFLTAFPFLLC